MGCSDTACPLRAFGKSGHAVRAQVLVAGQGVGLRMTGFYS
jgi:hypothetical protein